jgi:hypothetical protein
MSQKGSRTSAACLASTPPLSPALSISCSSFLPPASLFTGLAVASGGVQIGSGPKADRGDNGDETTAFAPSTKTAPLFSSALLCGLAPVHSISWSCLRTSSESSAGPPEASCSGDAARGAPTPSISAIEIADANSASANHHSVRLVSSKAGAAVSPDCPFPANGGGEVLTACALQP